MWASGNREQSRGSVSPNRFAPCSLPTAHFKPCRAAAGRPLAVGEDEVQAARPTVMLTQRLLQRRFGGRAPCVWANDHNRQSSAPNRRRRFMPRGFRMADVDADVIARSGSIAAGSFGLVRLPRGRPAQAGRDAR